MRTFIILLLGIIAFLVLGYFCTQQKKSNLNNNAISINSLIMKPNPELVDVKFLPMGDKAIIMGSVDSDASRLLAQRIIEAEGYFTVDNRINVNDFSYDNKHQVKIELSPSGKLNLTGVINNELIATELIELAFDKYGIKNVNTDLFSDPTSNPLIGKLSINFINALPMISYAEATVTSKQLMVNVASPSQSKLRQFKKNIIEQLPHQVKANFNLSHLALKGDTP